ncbi:hypothetical protein P5673_015418, partial [Acropora cervicornis]
ILMNVKKKTFGWNVKKLALNALISQDPTSAAVSEDINMATNTVKNTRGSYTCKCKTGFAGDGYQCILDEVYAQKKEINQIIIIGASTAGGSLLIILLIACLCCVNPKKPKPKKKKKAPKVPAIRDEWAADSSGSSGDSE